MSMFNISGTVLHTFDQPKRVDTKTGEVLSDEKPKVQIMGEMPVPNGQMRMELVTLTCEDIKPYESLKGHKISVALGIFSPAKGQVIYFIPKGSLPMSEGSDSPDSPDKKPKFDSSESGTFEVPVKDSTFEFFGKKSVG